MARPSAWFVKGITISIIWSKANHWFHFLAPFILATRDLSCSGIQMRFQVEFLPKLHNIQAFSPTLQEHLPEPSSLLVSVEKDPIESSQWIYLIMRESNIPPFFCGGKCPFVIIYPSFIIVQSNPSNFARPLHCEAPCCGKRCCHWHPGEFLVLSAKGGMKQRSHPFGTTPMTTWWLSFHLKLRATWFLSHISGLYLC